jgi:hypothetical protein
MAHHLGEVRGRDNAGGLNTLGFRKIPARKDYGTLLEGRLADGGEHAVHGPQVPAERELAVELVGSEPGKGQVAARGDDAECNREVEAATLFRQVRGRQVDGDAPRWPLEAGELNRRAHAVLRFSQCAFREPHDEEAREPRARVHVDRDGRRPHAEGGAAVNGGEHGYP